MLDERDPTTTRNLGFISAQQQKVLGESTVGIVGAGGDGGRIAVTLARMGLRRFKLADPEPFEIENMNRQTGCTTQTLGENKAEAIGRLVHAIAPESHVDVFNLGVTSENVAAFVTGCDVVVDESEFTQPHIGILVNREARRCCIPVVMGLNVGFGAVVTSFGPTSTTFEEYLGLDPEISIEAASSAAIDLWRWVPVVPQYSDPDALAQVLAGTLSAPSVAPGVDLCGGLASTEILAHLVNLRDPVWATDCVWMDAVEQRYERIHDRKSRFDESVAALLT